MPSSYGSSSITDGNAAHDPAAWLLSNDQSLHLQTPYMESLELANSSAIWQTTSI